MQLMHTFHNIKRGTCYQLFCLKIAQLLKYYTKHYNSYSIPNEIQNHIV